MPVRYRRTALAAVLTAAAVAVPVAALASGPGSPTTKPGHSPIMLKPTPVETMMNDGARVMRRPRRAWPWTARTAAAVIATAGLALLTTACSGSPSSTVANGASSAAGSSNTQWLAYSQCMRTDGVPGFPDPSSSGKPHFPAAQQLGVSSSRFQAAESACQHLQPGGGSGPTQAQVQQYRDSMLIYARCMRAHGISNFPDPDSRGHVNVGPGTDVDVNTPQFQAAYRVCVPRQPPSAGSP
jgi:hypothetical protein